ncbi:MAG: hypothetical protein LBS98_04800 [Coriobacteriales bacterium]|jgi:uncharacterized membrane protein|nr:hypothetical protein [Coriobacteriales bacterium]
MDKATKETYLSELETALASLTEADRSNAIAYYTEYLDDLGAISFDEAKTSLGTPKELARQVKADCAVKGLETPLTPPPLYYQAVPAGAVGAPNGAVGGSPYGTPTGTQSPQYYPAPQQEAPKKNSTPKVILIVILAIFALPVGVPLLVSAVAVIIAMLAGLASVLIGFAAVVFSLLATGVVAVVIGLVLLFSDFATGLFYLGGGFALLGVSLLFGALFYKLGGVCVKGVAKFFNWIRLKLSKKERGAK